MNTIQEIILNKESGIATILLNRPDNLNAFTIDMVKTWSEMLIECREDDDVKVIVLTGAGKAFCSGGDLRTIGSQSGQTAIERKNTLWENVHLIPKTLSTIDKPVIASLNGIAYGAGLDMALMCDLRIASDKAKFSEAYIKVGLVPGDGGAYFLPRLVGTAKALELLLTGKVIDAFEAERIGLVNMVVPADDLAAKTRELAIQLANGPVAAIRATKRAVMQGLQQDINTHLDMISSLFSIVIDSYDHKEAIQAISEKRAPQFIGK